MAKPLHHNLTSLLAAFLLLMGGVARAQSFTCPLPSTTPAATKDSCFAVADGFNGTVRAIVHQSDGKILVGGEFTAYQGQPVNRIARLNEDGSLDTSFHTGTGFSGTTYALAVQTDGMILVGGLFGAYQGEAVSNLARLMPDGSPDTAFNQASLVNSTVNAIALHPDGKIVIGGFFSNVGATSVVRGRIARLNTDGTVDTGFDVGVGANNTVLALLALSDGSVLAGGSFTQYRGLARSRIVRIQNTGEIDFTFNVGTGFDGTVNALARDSAGMYWIGGAFNNYQGSPAGRLLHLQTNGSREAGFSALSFGTGSTQVYSLAVQPDGKLLVGGVFTDYDGTPVGNLVRLASDGSNDLNFATNPGFNNAVWALALMSDGKVLAGGAFTTYKGQSLGHIARLMPDPTAVTAPLTFSISGHCAGSPVCFAVTSDTTDGSTYDWDFGDGTNGSGTQVCHTYVSATSYTVTVTKIAVGPPPPPRPARGVVPTTASQTFRLDSVPARPHFLQDVGGESVFLCQGDSLIFDADTAGMGGVRYVWSNGDTAMTVTLRDSGFYSFQAVNAAGCASVNSDSVHVILLPQTSMPTITASGPLRGCEGDSVTLTATAADEYLWSDGSTGQTVLVTVQNAGNYWVQVKRLDSCYSMPSDTVMVDFQALPIVDSITVSGSTSLCDGDAVTLTAPPAIRYVWNTGDTTQSITVDSAATYTVQIGNAYCFADSSASLTVTVGNRPPRPTLTFDIHRGQDSRIRLAFCTVDTAHITASLADHYLWNTGDTTQAITVRAPGEYYVITSMDSGFSCPSLPSDTVDAVIDTAAAPPIISPTGLQAICEGSSITLTSSDSNTVWSNGQTGISITVDSAGTYYGRIQTPLGCRSGKSDSVTVVINARPAAPSISADGPLSFCAGGSVQLTSSADTGNVWSTGDTTQTITVTQSGSYTVFVTSDSGCASAPSQTITVTVIDSTTRPNITIVGGTQFCAGGSVTLQSSSPIGNVWSNGDTTQTIVVDTTASISLHLQIGACRSAETGNVLVSLLSKPDAPVILNPQGMAFCEGGFIILQTADSMAIWNTGDTTAALSVSTSGVYYAFNVSEDGCRSDTSAKVTIEVVPRPAAPVVSQPALSFCEGVGGTLTALAPDSASLIWSTGETTDTIQVDSAGIYTVLATNGPCQSLQSDTVFVSIIPRPAAPVVLASGPLRFCQGGSVTLTAQDSVNRILWTTSDTTQSITVSQAGVYGASAINGLGCTSSQTEVQVIIETPPVAGFVQLPGTGGISLVSTDTLVGATYQWFLGGVQLPNTTDSLFATESGDYTLVLTTPGGCTDSVTQTVTITGARGLVAMHITLQPNPARGQVHLQAAGLRGTTQLLLRDAKGNAVLRRQVSAAQAASLDLSLGEVSTGLYLLELTDTAGHRWIGRLTVE